MIGIIAAMDVEMKSLRSFMTDTKTETVSGITFVSGTLEGKLVVTAVCGISRSASSTPAWQARFRTS